MLGVLNHIHIDMKADDGPDRNRFGPMIPEFSVANVKEAALIVLRSFILP